MSRPAILGSFWITFLPALLALGFTRFALGSQYASPVDLAPPSFVLGADLTVPALTADQLPSAGEVLDSRLFTAEQSATILNSVMYGGQIVPPPSSMPAPADASLDEAFRGQITDVAVKPAFYDATATIASPVEAPFGGTLAGGIR